jgi:hypothetical protein
VALFVAQNSRCASKTLASKGLTAKLNGEGGIRTHGTVTRTTVFETVVLQRVSFLGLDHCREEFAQLQIKMVAGPRNQSSFQASLAKRAFAAPLSVKMLNLCSMHS